MYQLYIDFKEITYYIYSVVKINLGGEYLMNQKYEYPKTRAQLNQLVADLEQVQTNVHQTHWYYARQTIL